MLGRGPGGDGRIAEQFGRPGGVVAGDRGPVRAGAGPRRRSPDRRRHAWRTPRPRRDGRPEASPPRRGNGTTGPRPGRWPCGRRGRPTSGSLNASTPAPPGRPARSDGPATVRGIRRKARWRRPTCRRPAPAEPRATDTARAPDRGPGRAPAGRLPAASPGRWSAAANGGQSGQAAPDRSDRPRASTLRFSTASGAVAAAIGQFGQQVVAPGRRRLEPQQQLGHVAGRVRPILRRKPAGVASSDAAASAAYPGPGAVGNVPGCRSAHRSR